MPAGSVVISGVDRLTAVLDKITAKVEASNKRWSAVADPFKRVQASLGKLAAATGLDRIGKSFRDIAFSARDAFGKVSQVVAPLGAITGAASLAGMYRMVSVWSDWGSKLGFAAQNINIAASDLSGLEGAARLSGSSAGSLTAGLQNLGQTMFDAIGGRAPEAIVMFNTLGISFRDATGHARSVADVMPEVADKIASIRDPYVQARIATELFGAAGADLLPFLRKGRDGILEYQRAAARYNPVTEQSIAAANQFREAQSRLTKSVEGLGNRISTRLAPILSPLLTQLADWIATNPEVQRGIDALARVVQQFAGWLQTVNWQRVGDELYRWGSAAASVVDAVGGIKTAVEIVGGVMLATFAVRMILPWIRLAGVIASATGKVARFAAAEEAAGAAGGVAGATGRFARIGRMAGSALLGEQLVDAVDPTDTTGAWIDRNIPGASFVDNAASYIGAGRSYAQQREVDPESRAGLGPRPGSYRPSSAEQAKAAQDATSYFETRGWTRAQAAGIAASLQQESGFNAQAVGDGGAALGQAQWHADRQRAIEAHFGKPVSQMSRREQWDAVNWELREGGEQGAGRRLALATTARDAGAVVSQFYERPGDVEGEKVRRGGMAEAIASRASAQGPASAPPAPAGPAQDAPGPAAAPMALAASGPPLAIAQGLPLQAPAADDPGQAPIAGAIDLRLHHVNPQPEGFSMDIVGGTGDLSGARIAQANVTGNLP